MKVKRRDESLLVYDRDKIGGAILKAFLANGADPIHLERIVVLVELKMQEKRNYRTFKEFLESDSIFSVEEIQDVVEQILMMDHPEIAKSYILYRKQREDLRNCKPDPNAVADYIHAAKYARYLPVAERRETFRETIERVEQMHIRRFPKLKTEINEAFNLVYNKQVLPSMRSMQFAGRAIEDENARMYNCCFTLIDRPAVFGEILYLLLCGCGVGFSVQKHHVSKLPKIQKVDRLLVCHFSIKDTCIGWAEAIHALIDGFRNGYHVQFDYSEIRPSGSELKVSGGRAPGHLSLMQSIETIRIILSGAENRHLRPIECHDIICTLSAAVLAGGIRRSSLISLFSQEDEEMIHCKDGFHLNQRFLCNNSVVFNRETTREKFLSIMDLNKSNCGDPGFVFIDDPDMGINPCGEILLDPTFDDKTGFGFCNLVEVNTARCTDIKEAVKAATFIATLQASYTDFKFIGFASKLIAHRDALIGVSLTGIYDSPIQFSSDLLKELAEICKELNKIYAERIGINPAKRCTCIKPSGTASLELGGISSGIHPNHAKRYFRRITANLLEPIAQIFRKHNPHMVEVKPDGDWCITFPMTGKYEPQTALEFLNKIKMFYDSWIAFGSDELHHNISCTVSVKSDEWDDVFKFIWQYKPIGMTFLPAQKDKDIPFCPREAVETPTDIIKYLSLVKNYKPIDYTCLPENEDKTVFSSSCDGDSCDFPLNLIGGNGEQVFLGQCSEHQFNYRGNNFELVEQRNDYFIAKRRE